MRVHFVIRVYILTDPLGEWWEVVKKDGSTRMGALLPDREFGSAEAAVKYADRHFKRFNVIKLTPPIRPERTWDEQIVVSVDKRPVPAIV